MFTGLVLGTGCVKRLEHCGFDAHLTIMPQFPVREIRDGDSVAVDGACLTVVKYDNKDFVADVSAETLARTILGNYRRGRLVNLELALRMNDRLGGHLVTGHIDGVAVLRRKASVGESLKLDFSLDEKLAGFLIEKGSIAINGISLTLNTVGRNGFDVNVVPHTMRKTTVYNWKIGDRVNIELDIIGKYVAKFLQKRVNSEEKKKVIDRNFLEEHGIL